MRRLEAHKNVLRVQKNYFFLRVTFDTGITEWWALNEKALKRRRKYLFKLPYNRDHFNGYEIPTYKQFETNPLYPERYEILKNHFIIKAQDLEKAGWAEVRLKVHDIAVDLKDEGWVDIQYPDDILQQDWTDLLNEDLSRYKSGKLRFSAFGGRLAFGRRLVMHFMPCAAKDQWNFDQIYQVVNRLVRNRDITREGIVYYLARPHQTIRHPAFYRSIFKQWIDIKDKTVYDLHPDWGFKALAVLAEGGHYVCDSPNITQLQKMGSFVGGEVSKPLKHRYGVIILSDVHPVNKESARSLIDNFYGIADYLMITIKQSDCKELAEQYKPWRILRVNDELIENATKDNYIFLIKT